MGKRLAEDPARALLVPLSAPFAASLNALIRAVPIILVILPLALHPESGPLLKEWWCSVGLLVQVLIVVAFLFHIFQESLIGAVRKKKWIPLTTAARELYGRAPGPLHEILRNNIGKDPDSSLAFYIVNASYEGREFEIFEQINDGYPLEPLRKTQFEALQISLSLPDPAGLDRLYVSRQAVERTMAHLGFPPVERLRLAILALIHTRR